MVAPWVVNARSGHTIPHARRGLYDHPLVLSFSMSSGACKLVTLVKRSTAKNRSPGWRAGGSPFSNAPNRTCSEPHSCGSSHKSATSLFGEAKANEARGLLCRWTVNPLRQDFHYQTMLLRFKAPGSSRLLLAGSRSTTCGQLWWSSVSGKRSGLGRTGHVKCPNASELTIGSMNSAVLEIRSASLIP